MIGICFCILDPLRVEWVMERMVYNARNLGATHIFVIDKTRYQTAQYYDHGDGAINFELVPDVASLERRYKDTEFVFFENDKTLTGAGATVTPLPKFTHPDSCIYVVGPDFGADILRGRAERTWVTIPVRDMWAEAVLLCTLYDRLAKK